MSGLKCIYKRISNGFKTHCHKRISGAFRRRSEMLSKAFPATRLRCVGNAFEMRSKMHLKRAFRYCCCTRSDVTGGGRLSSTVDVDGRLCQPSWILFSRVLQKVRGEEATITLVAPVCRLNRPVLLEMVIEEPRRLPHRLVTFLQSYRLSLDPLPLHLNAPPRSVTRRFGIQQTTWKTKSLRSFTVSSRSRLCLPCSLSSSLH